MDQNQSMLKNLTWSLFSATVVIGCFIAFIYLEKNFEFFRFSKSQILTENEKSYLQFKESAKDLGITHNQEVLDLSTHLEGYSGVKNYKNFLPTSSGVATVDYNNDGYMDLFFVNGISARSFFLYENNKKGGFIDVTSKVGLFVSNDRIRLMQVATFFDYNNDGYKDLYVGFGKYSKLYQNIGGKKFIDVTAKMNASPADGVMTGLKVIDYNNDGWPDIYGIMIFSTKVDGANNSVTFFSPRITKNNRSFSNGNFLLKNIRGERFELVPNAGGASNNQLTWDAAVVDFNYDGWQDLLVANDFSIVRAYQNNKEGGFFEVTDSLLGQQFTSSNMGIIFSDINNDGKFDFYVTNLSRSTYTSLGYNQFFIQNKDNSYTDKFDTFGTDKCGWSWGSQFVDFDLDGTDEIVVVNGMFDDGPTDYFFKWFVYITLPPFVVNSPRLLPNTAGHRLASHERNCLFKKTDDRTDYKDVALSAGVEDIENGRGVATIDIENNGKISFVISNHAAPPTFYKNVSALQRDWVGFNLTGSKSGKDAVGATIKAIFTDGTSNLKLHNPFVGFSSQKDPRVVFALNNKKIESLEVSWPSGRKQTIKKFKINSYNEIVEPN